ncbi:MAG: hypothetical protein Q8P88_02205 [Candidatus Jorgensenbacteria bacterium]|nr:hypothetical protein [Candidatus Jorgensenbacteria bacterium]
MDVPSSPLAAALIGISNKALPVPWWLLALAAIFVVLLIAKIISLLDERRKLKAEIALLEGKEMKGPVPDTEMGGSGD